MSVPGYWMNETSGVLRPVVVKHLDGGELDERELMLMRAYLREWMRGSFWGRDAAALRRRVSTIDTTADLREWMRDALHAGIDPL